MKRPLRWALLIAVALAASGCANFGGEERGIYSCIRNRDGIVAHLTENPQVRGNLAHNHDVLEVSIEQSPPSARSSAHEEIHAVE